MAGKISAVVEVSRRAERGRSALRHGVPWAAILAIPAPVAVAASHGVVHAPWR